MISHRCSEELNMFSQRKSTVVQNSEKCGEPKAEELEVIETVLRNALSMVGNYGASLFCSPGVFGEPESAIKQMANMLQNGSMPMPFLKFLLAAAHENDEDAFNQVRMDDISYVGYHLPRLFLSLYAA